MSTLHSVDADQFDEAGRPVSGDAGRWHHGQARFAYALAREYADALLHVRGIGWMAWDGIRWVEDTGQAKRAVLQLLREGWKRAIKDKELRQDVLRCESAAGISGVLNIAAALVEFSATIADLDADPGLLNCANGTLDLRTGELRPHDPRDRLSKAARAAYRPAVDRGVWDGFLASVLPDSDERAYLQRVVGQALYGRVTEHLFPVLTGTGGNGKGTFYGAVRSALGDYATVVDPSMLMAQRADRAPGPEMMQLLGARLVIGSETGDGRRLDESTMKRLTGGDELTARNLYQPPVTWLPTHQLLYVTNHLPKVSGADPAVWRRVRVIPFTVDLDPTRYDLTLPERLELHADAVLSWAVEGYQDWHTAGMREPATVVKATSDYRSSADAVGRFIEDQCLVNPLMFVATADLWERWQAWCQDDGSDPRSQRWFGQELDRRGFHADRTNAARIWRGIGLQSADEDGSP